MHRDVLFLKGRHHVWLHLLEYAEPQVVLAERAEALDGVSRA